MVENTVIIYKNGLDTLLQFIKNDFPKLYIIPTKLSNEKSQINT